MAHFPQTITPIGPFPALSTRLVYVCWIVYLCLCTVFGEDFYRYSLVGLSVSEYLCFGLILVTVLYRRHFINRDLDPLIIAVGTYWLLAVLVSLFFTEARPYFVFRQGSHLFYFSTAFMLSAVLGSGHPVWWRDRAPIILVSFLIAMLLSGLFNESNRDASLPLLLAALIICNGKYKLLSILAIVVFALLIGHASYIMAVGVFLATIASLTYRVLIPYLLCAFAALVLLLFPVILSMEELNDVNALWRYYYWKDLILHTSRDLTFLHGSGYGVPYIHPDFEYFQQLVKQVEGGKGIVFQMYTVPPHNSFLNIYYHLGIVAFLLFLGYFIKLGIRCYRARLNIELGALLGTAVAMLSHNALELPYISLGVSLVIAQVLNNLGRAEKLVRYRPYEPNYRHAFQTP